MSNPSAAVHLARNGLLTVALKALHPRAQAVVLMLSLGAVGFGSYASLTALQQQAQAATLTG